jgi:hypothetical protein
LENLPLEIQRKICVFVGTSTDGLFADLDSRIVRGLDFSLFKVARNFREWLRFSSYGMSYMIGNHAPSTIQLSSTETPTDFEGFQGLWDICPEGHNRQDTYNLSRCGNSAYAGRIEGLN